MNQQTTEFSSDGSGAERFARILGASIAGIALFVAAASSPDDRGGEIVPAAHAATETTAGNGPTGYFPDQFAAPQYDGPVVPVETF